MPAEPEVWGLSALMCLQDSRRDTRVDATGRAVPLDEQNRGRWNRERIAEGLACMTVASESGGGRYAIEASIAAAHAVAPTFADSDWVGIVGAYDRLPALRESPAVRINRAVAVSFRDGPTSGCGWSTSWGPRRGSARARGGGVSRRSPAAGRAAAGGDPG
ncbi:hypothetical protein GS688_25060 [Rhodococcus hoagii]|nr:hypothetical protein [Prescottella equi]